MTSLTELTRNSIYNQRINQINTKNKCIINTLNAHSYCLAKNNSYYLNALLKSDILLPDGVSIVYAAKILNGLKISKIAGADVHKHLLVQANRNFEKVFYLGSSESTLKLISDKVKDEFPNIKIKTFSPPYKDKFSSEEIGSMISEINNFIPDILFVGMTAPKQEEWVAAYNEKLNVRVIASIGAVFDFYAGTVERAPEWIINLGLEWLYRLKKEPKRLWKRYLINNCRFIFYVIREKSKSILSIN